MKDTQSRIVNRAVAGKTIMDDPDNVGIWTGRAAIETKKTELNKSIDRVGEIDDEINNTTGNAVSKTKAKDDAAKTAWKGAKALGPYAEDKHDDILAAEIKFSWSELRYGKDMVLIDRWKLVRDRADTYATDLDTGGYGSDAALVTLLSGQIDAFAGWKGKPKAAIATTKALNKALELECKNLANIIDSLEERLAQFAITKPDFYNAAIDAFSSDDIGVRHRALQVIYLDDVTGIRLPKVACEIVELGLKKKASKVGNVPFPFEELPQGNYTVNSKLPTYVEQSHANVVSEEGKMTKLIIRMVKL